MDITGRHATQISQLVAAEEIGAFEAITEFLARGEVDVAQVFALMAIAQSLEDLRYAVKAAAP